MSSTFPRRGTALPTAVADTLALPPSLVNEDFPASSYHDRKQWVDRTLALLMLIPGLPMIGILVVLVRLTSAGPGIFRQVRSGKNGRPYTMYKLRSMRCDAEAKSGPAWSQAGDTRVTLVGRILRKLHLDELPQLFNVLKGEMALIGPRPERPEFVDILAEAIPDYTKRLEVLPGITGLAQINLPADTDLDSVRRKLVLDREYVTTATMWLDLRILACTLLRIFGLSGLRAMRATGLERKVDLPVAASDDGSAKSPPPPSVAISELVARARTMRASRSSISNVA
jgi:lipopolysaccharide/colanic/teichoic acid biosynthesis glycosyltransferase